MRKTQEIKGKDNVNIEISESLLASPINEKLQHTKFKDMTVIAISLTRNTSRRLGLSSCKLPKKCTGNKIINMDMLNDSLHSMSPTNFCCVRCGSKSKIALHEDPKMKYGQS